MREERIAKRRKAQPKTLDLLLAYQELKAEVRSLALRLAECEKEVLTHQHMSNKRIGVSWKAKDSWK